MLGDRLDGAEHFIKLMGRRQMVRQIAQHRAGQRALASTAAYTFWHIAYTAREALRIQDAYVWSSPAGDADVLVNVSCARGNDRDYGALLTDALMRAELAHGYLRSRHLHPSPYGPSYDLPQHAIAELRGAMREAETYAGAAAAGEWRERFEWTGPAIERARDLLEQLQEAEHVPEPEDPAWRVQARQRARHAIELFYGGEREPEPVTREQLEGLRAWIAEHGTEAGYPHAVIALDRTARLNAAAWTDYLALANEARDGQTSRGVEDQARELAGHLFVFDDRHHTARSGNDKGEPSPYWYAHQEFRGHVRDEWRNAADPDAPAQ